MNYFDIETVPLSKEAVERMMPYELKNPVMPDELRHPIHPVFEHKSLKDKEKLKAWKEAKERDWKESLRLKIHKWNIETMDKVSMFHERAALQAETGQVAVIGYGWSGQDEIRLAVNAKLVGKAFLDVKKPKNVKILAFGDETSILQDFISSIENYTEAGYYRNWAGFAIKHFDLPFIRKRCWLNKVKFPTEISKNMLQGYMWDWFIDLQEVWASGDRTVRVSQDFLSLVFGLETKPSDGAMFWKLLKEDPAAAFTYAAHDISSIVQFGDIMGIEKEKEGLGLT